MIVMCQLSLITPAVQVPERLFWFCGNKFAFFSYLSPNQNNSKNHKQKNHNKLKVSQLGEYWSFSQKF